MTTIEPGSPEWQALVRKARLVSTASCWEIGDLALDVAPVLPNGGDRHSRQFDARQTEHRLRQFAEDTEIPYPSLHRYRYVSHAWPGWKRNPTCSHRVHLILASQPDRFTLIRDHMKIDEAEHIVIRRKQASTDPTRTTVLSILASINEAKHRLRIAFRDTTSFGPSDSDKEYILDSLADLETEAEQFRNYLTGMGLDEAIAEILEGTR